MITAPQLRQKFTQFFVDRGHTLVDSGPLIPHHQLAPLFTNAGMVQFLPYFLGEEAPPYPRATSVQKCVRIRGKHDDIELIGRTTRHLTTFEMLGNFSFGDYFKEGAIRFHWELFTEVLGLDGDRLWITVHTNDDTAHEIWRDAVGIPEGRIQRMDEDNFWEMGETGPCGTSSELYFDRGSEFGPEGGPLYGGDERYREIGNLVFMEFDRAKDGSLSPLPKQNIDTGSGLERILPTLQGVDSVFDIDSIRPILGVAESITGQTYGRDDETDVSLRIVTDHARAMTLLTSDGVFPSNEDRGYVLRRIVRRALRHAYKVGGKTVSSSQNVARRMVGAVVDVMGEAYPELKKNQDFVAEVLDREEARFAKTVSVGLQQLNHALESTETISGETAFLLHDTYGFPIELTAEIAGERGVPVDHEGFAEAMELQRSKARAAARQDAVDSATGEAYRKLVEEHGQSVFVGYERTEADTVVTGVLQVTNGTDLVEVFLEHTPFYAEQGGQIGDTGWLTGEGFRAEVVDAQWALPGLAKHVVRVTEGVIQPGASVHAAIDVARRDAIRRNHTGTHLLHWALRKVLGDHVKQAGSLVAPDHLRFDFSHFAAVTPEEIAEIERLANREVLSNAVAETIETTKADALEHGAIAFFGDKYGDEVRMLQAGPHSLEFCGGTHVRRLGDIGTIIVTSESSIGSNLRRIEAITGEDSVARMQAQGAVLRNVSTTLRANSDEIEVAIERLLEKQKSLEAEKAELGRKLRAATAIDLVAQAENGAVILRQDGLTANELRELALELRRAEGIDAVVLIGSPDGKGVSLVAATPKGGDRIASDLLADAAKLVGGGGGKGPDLAMAGGRDASRIDEALAAVREAYARS